jgi:hypothetical protein
MANSEQPSRLDRNIHLKNVVYSIAFLFFEVKKFLLNINSWAETTKNRSLIFGDLDEFIRV